MSKKRVYTALVVIVFLFSGVSTRILYLTQTTYRPISVQQSTRRQVIATSRGTIYDRYLQPLVNRETHIVAAISPQADVLETIGRSLSKQEADVLLRELKNGEPILSELSFWLPPTSGITQVSAPIRYSEDSPAAHLIGYINNESHGVAGIEKGYDEVLSRYCGEVSVTYQIDALGNVVITGEEYPESTLSNSVGGVALTIDCAVQSAVYEAAKKGLERGAIVVSDPYSGEVMASVSTPDFDQNQIEDSLSDSNAPLFDRTLADYNCGSVFKIVVAAAALEKGIGMNREYTCTGSLKIGENTFHCHNPLGDGKQTMKEAFACSCNCYFMQLAKEVGAKAIREMACSLGFEASFSLANGVQTAVAFLPTTQTLSADAALANFSIGQGEVMASPYHINAMTAAVANNGIWVAPTVYYGEVDPSKALTIDAVTNGKRVFSEQTAQCLRELLVGVVENGTGVLARPQSGEAAGKTGTAETGWEINGEEIVQSWFTGYFPADNPRYAITVLSENGANNEKPATVVFADICDRLSSAGLTAVD